MLFNDMPVDYTIIDIETTGLSRRQHEIIEIAAVQYRDDQETGRFVELIRPVERIPYFITRLTGIDDQMVSQARTIAQVLPELRDFVGTDTLIAHNTRFDIPFINDKFQRILNQPALTNPSLDTVALSRRLVHDVTSHKLNVLADYFGIDASGHHRAMADVQMTYQLYLALKRLANRS